MCELTAFEIKSQVKKGNMDLAEGMVARLIGQETGLDVTQATIYRDRYSLNSVNGVVTTEREGPLFFKFHTEEEESSNVKEYYQASILSEAGLPVDMPVLASTKPGRQFLLYAFSRDPKLADVCLQLERGGDSSYTITELLEAQVKLDEISAHAALSTLSEPNSASCEEPIHQLFYNRLVDQGVTDQLGGRYRQFYKGRSLSIEGKEVSWDRFESLRWVINDIEYTDSLRELFLRSLQMLSPRRLAAEPCIVSHGDAHNANVWVRQTPGEGRVHFVYFDPAFAGRHIPALLGEIKATFHNVFAHPYWLYTPEYAETAFKLFATIRSDRIIINHNWDPGELRRAFLYSKFENYWLPLLIALKHKEKLPEDWETVMRLSLFCCPTLVINLLPNEQRSLSASLLGFAIALLCGSSPVNGLSFVSELFAKCRRELSHS